MITIGSCFSGIGGFELGLERSIPNSKTIWQVEQNKFCQRILKKHWPDARLYDDIRRMDTQDVERTDILCGGFPCQDISICGKGAGIHGKKSGLWSYMLALISRLRPHIVVLENVSAITIRGGQEVLESLTELGYNCEWGVIRSGSTFGAPHRRARWFCVAYSNTRSKRTTLRTGRKEHTVCDTGDAQSNASNTNSERAQVSLERKYPSEQLLRSKSKKRNFWKEVSPPSPLCGMDDGIPNRVDRIKALGNAIVPQCAEWIGEQIWKSGLLSSSE